VDNYGGKKNDHYLILYARIWHSSWGGAFTKAGGSSTTMSFFFLLFISLSLALVFVPGL